MFNREIIMLSFNKTHNTNAPFYYSRYWSYTNKTNEADMWCKGYFIPKTHVSGAYNNYIDDVSWLVSIRIATNSTIKNSYADASMRNCMIEDSCVCSPHILNDWNIFHKTVTNMKMFFTWIDPDHVIFKTTEGGINFHQQGIRKIIHHECLNANTTYIGKVSSVELDHSDSPYFKIDVMYDLSSQKTVREQIKINW